MNDYDPSAFNPAGGNHGAQGIGQWRGPRVDAFAARYGHEPRAGTMQEQMDFMLDELRGRERASGQALRTSNTASGAAEAMVRLYGRPLPQDLPELARQRMGWAEGWQRRFAAPAPPSSGASGPQTPPSYSYPPPDAAAKSTPQAEQQQPAGANGTLRVEVVHRDPPPGTSLRVGSDSDNIDIGSMRIERAMSSRWG